MLYSRADGSISMTADNESIIAEAGIVKLEEAIKAIDAYYEHLDTAQHGRLRAMAGRLIAIVEE